MYVAIRYQHKIYICNETFQCLEAMINNIFTRLRQKSMFFSGYRQYSLPLAQVYSVLVSVSCPKALYHLESDNLFRITAVVADWLG